MFADFQRIMLSIVIFQKPDGSGIPVIDAGFHH
jgi:hypothetical protein